MTVSDKVYNIKERMPNVGEQIVFRGWKGLGEKNFLRHPGKDVGVVIEIDLDESSMNLTALMRFTNDDTKLYFTHYSLVNDTADTPAGTGNIVISNDEAQAFTDKLLDIGHLYILDNNNLKYLLASIGFPTEATKRQTVEFDLPSGFDASKLVVLVNGEPVEFEVVKTRLDKPHRIV